MVRRITWVGLLVVIGLLLAKGVGRAEDVKIGVVDVNKIFSNYSKVTETQAEFDKIKTQRQGDVQKKADAADKEIKVLLDKLDKQGTVMKKEETDKIKTEIEKKKQDILNLQQKIYQELQQKNRELVDARVKEINAATGELAKKEGYSVVINKEAVLYSPEMTDLTDQVIAYLNNKPAPPKK
ncbi:MAG: OmpH family outer membrane protein [Candidatus Omnitrophica bacterium]|nr:OmpH family outer membrane protein [Candidatus Omnitrophota bacterium]